MLWHREMEGGLVVGQHLNVILPGRSRIVRSFSGHNFSMWQNDNEIQNWTMDSAKRQHYKLSSSTRVPPVQAATSPRKATSPSTSGSADAPKQPDPRVLAEARQLAAKGKYREALKLFRSAGDVDAATRPKLAARIAHLERIIASEDMIKGHEASSSSPKPSGTTSAVPRCDKCTLPVPCGKAHVTKRTYAEVRIRRLLPRCCAYTTITARAVTIRWSRPSHRIRTARQREVSLRRRFQTVRGHGG